VVDPGLQYELNAQKPWFASKLLSSMNVLNIREPLNSNCNNVEELEISLGPWKWGGKYHLEEDNTHLLESDTSNHSNPTKSTTARPFKKDSSAERRKYFTKRNLDRSKARFSTKYIYGMEVVYYFKFFSLFISFQQVFSPYINLNTLDLTMGVHVNMYQYMKGQPFTFICKSRSRNTPLFIIQFRLE
jgi:hypothetical protein